MWYLEQIISVLHPLANSYDHGQVIIVACTGPESPTFGVDPAPVPNSPCSKKGTTEKIQHDDYYNLSKAVKTGRRTSPWRGCAKVNT